jgi:hypothetical protein
MIKKRLVDKNMEDLGKKGPHLMTLMVWSRKFQVFKHLV